MAEDDQGKVHGSSDGGVAGQHPQAGPRQIVAAPSTADQLNKIELPPPVVACFRVDDIRFAFDSSFVTSNAGDAKNDIRAELKLLVQLLKDNPQSPLSVYGHADPVGDDNYNKKLSGRRATVIYALLISTTDPDTAVKLWKAVASQENWGTDQRQTMQALTGLPAGTADSQLFKSYMQKLAPADLKISKQDFLGQGADPLGKADYQGCSEFNPVLIFSDQRNQQFESDKDKTARNDANASNRRVMVLLFQKGVKVDPTKWPCPRATEGVADCRARFWSNGDTKRNTRLPDKDRKFDDKSDPLKGTFACRFYERMVTGKSPCEKELTVIKIRLFDRQSRPLPGAPCLVTESGKNPKPDRASGTAGAVAPLIPDPTTPDPTTATQGDTTDSAYIIFREQSLPASVNVKWSRPKAGDGPNSPLPQPSDTFEFEMDVAIDVPENDQQKASLTRLKSLGYVQGPTQADDIRAFQIENKARFGLTVDGTLSDDTQKAIKAVHDACDPVLKGPRNTPL
jgi:hypothetical protein